MDLDLRKLRYFAAVAEHRHFGRAAAALYIAQPVLSRQIRALEKELGCALLHRTTRRVQLTPAGEQLRDEACGVSCVPIGSEPKVVCLPTSHPLARRRRLTVADLSGERLVDAHARRTSAEEKFELVAAGSAIAVMPHSAARFYSRPDVVHRLVIDAEPSETCVVVAPDRREQRILDFSEVAVETLRARSPSSPTPGDGGP